MNRLRHAPLLLLVLLGLALLVRAAVPSGWMPVAGHEGVRIALCSGQGAILSIGGAGGHDHHGKGHHHREHQPSAKEACPFAMIAQPFDRADDHDLSPPPTVRPTLTGHALVAARLVAWRSLRPPARGPPPFA